MYTLNTCTLIGFGHTYTCCGVKRQRQDFNQDVNMHSEQL